MRLTAASEIYNREKDANTASGRDVSSLDPWYKSVLTDYRALAKEKLPPGYSSGATCTSVCINTPMYLSYLVGRCISNGVILKRAVLSHISDAASLHSSGPDTKADIIINCTGLLASKLGGVMDKSVFPIRGQTVVVRNDPGVMMCSSSTDDGPDEMCYIMTRAAGGGTIRIMKRAVELCPQLVENGQGIEGLSVIRHGVGLRPGREGGVRIEKERVEGYWVVHNYGHAGWGYQGSYGCSERVLELVDEILEGKPKL
jgi:D-amino-acid oxidase